MRILSSNSYGPPINGGAFAKKELAGANQSIIKLDKNSFNPEWVPIIRPSSWDKSEIRKRIQETASFFSRLKDFEQDQKVALAQFLFKGVPLGRSDLNYEKYFQFPNERVKKVAMSIVSPGDSDEEKVYKIEQWVIKNIQYVSDIKNYKQDEYWAYPTETLAKMSGDCEDGNFLIISLALNAGVDPSRLIFYGGRVFVSDGSLELGGHGWAGFERDLDEEIVPVDFCYYPTSDEFSERKTLEENLRYWDTMFYIEPGKGTVETPHTNALRLSGYGVNRNGFLTGLMIDIKA